MITQTTMPDINAAESRTPSSEAGGPSARHHNPARRLPAELLSLIELQLKLFRLDFGVFANQARASILMLTAAVVAALASLPVVLSACGDSLAAVIGIPPWAGKLLSAILLALLPACVLGLAAAGRLRNATRSFERSQNELRRNLRWLRQRLKE